jgi:hypothetical protein
VLWLRGGAGAGPPWGAGGGVRAQQRLIQIELILTAADPDQGLPADPAASGLALGRLAGALGGSVHLSFEQRQWSASIVLPRHTGRGPDRSPAIAYSNFGAI